MRRHLVNHRSTLTAGLFCLCSGVYGVPNLLPRSPSPPSPVHPLRGRQDSLGSPYSLHLQCHIPTGWSPFVQIDEPWTLLVTGKPSRKGRPACPAKLHRQIHPFWGHVTKQTGVMWDREVRGCDPETTPSSVREVFAWPVGGTQGFIPR